MTHSDILKRYDMTVDNKFIIHANIPSYAALFEKYDYTSSFYKRDINEKLVDYLLECAGEIGNRNSAVIRFDLPEKEKSETEEGDIITGFTNYFDYLTTLSRKEIALAIKRMLIHLSIAVFAVLMWFLFAPGRAENPLLLHSSLPSGLFAAVWVLLLTGISRFLYRVQIQLRQIRLFKKIKVCPIQFNYIDQGGRK
jgi:hypothetical protein